MGARLGIGLDQRYLAFKYSAFGSTEVRGRKKEIEEDGAGSTAAAIERRKSNKQFGGSFTLH